MPGKANDLHLPDLVIRNFRGVRNLDISRLGRVTLLTGRNGVGKTTILEALEVYMAAGSYRVLQKVLEEREEVVSEPEAERGLVAPVNWFALFHGQRKWLPGGSDSFAPNTSMGGGLSLTVGPKSKQRWLALRLARSSDEMADRVSSEAEGMADLAPPMSLFVKFRRKKEREMPVTPVPRRLPWRLASRYDDPGSEGLCHRLGPGVPDRRQLARHWDRVTLTPQEELVVSALRLVARDAPERIALVGSEDGRMSSRRFVVRLSSQEERVPLKSLGDGANRLFSLVLALSNVKGGFLLIDEAENGIHHRVQESYWSLIFRFARENNVQVVATTHSWDGVRGFANAAREHRNDAALIRLRRSNGEIGAVEYKPEEIQVVAKQGIEVR